MEYVEGETLAQVLGRLKETTPETETSFGKKDDGRYFMNIAEAVADIADGLQHAHSKGVIHRDIKPSNLILDGDGHLRILDFGLARLEGQESLTLSGDFVGTPAYMSPEQARRKKIPVDHRTDIYSLGATLYEVLTHQRTFRGKDHSDTLSQIIERDPRPPRQLNPRVPADLETIVLKCLRKGAGDRYGTAEALGQDLRRFVRGDPIEARPLGPWAGLLRSASRRRAHLTVGALAFLAAVASLLAIKAEIAARHMATRSRYEALVLEAADDLQLGPWIQLGTGKTARDRLRKGLYWEDLPHNAGLDVSPLERAVETLEEAAAVLPDRPVAAYYQARGYHLLGKNEQALRAVSRAVALEPGFAPALSLLALLRTEETAPQPPAVRGEQKPPLWAEARAAVQHADWEMAEKAYTLLLAAERAEPSYLGSAFEAYMGRGIARLEADQPRKALGDFVAAGVILPEAIAPQLFVGKVYYELGWTEEAEETFFTLWENTRQPDQVAWEIGNFYDGFSRFEEALTWFQRMSPSLHRERARVRMSYRLSWWKSGAIDEALAAAREAIAQNPANPTSHALLAQSLAFTNRLGEARRAAGEAVRLGAAEWPRALWALANVYSSLRETERGLQAIRRAVDLRPQNVDLRNALGVFLFQRGRYGEAVVELKKVVQSDPNPHIALSNIGQAYGCLGRFDEALGAFDESLDKNPKFAWTYKARAEIQSKAGDQYGAVQSLVHAAALQPPAGDKYPVKALARLLRQLDSNPVPELGALLVTAEARLERYGPSVKLLHLLALASLYGVQARDPRRALEYTTRAAALTDKPAPLLLVTRAHAEMLAGRTKDAVLTLDEPLRRTSVTRFAEDLYERCAKALYPRLPSFASVDRMFILSGSSALDEGVLLEDIRAASRRGEVDEGLAEYVAACVLERQGRAKQAADLFVEVSAGAPAQLEPHLGLVRSLRGAGEDTKALHHVEDLLSGVLRKPRELWNVWIDLQLNALEKPAAAALEDFPLARDGADGNTEDITAYANDIRWILETLAASGPLLFNCGGQEYESVAGVRWARDRFHLGGRRYSRWGGVTKGAFLGEIRKSEDDRLFQTERSFDEDALDTGYAIPLPDGEYEVRLHFAEVYFQAPGLRRFTIIVEGAEVEGDYDPFSRVGFGTPDVVAWQTHVLDGLLEIKFMPLTGRPKVSAIEIERQ